MSTLKVTNIQSNGAGFNDVVSFQNSGGTQNGTLCRAWVNFRGTLTVTIRDSFNVTSITDNGTGDYTVNITNALSDNNYCVTFGTNSTNTSGYPTPYTPNTYTTTSFRIVIGKNAVSDDDCNLICASVFR